MHHSRRQFYEDSSTHLGVYCRKLGLTPNGLTAISLMCAIVSGYFFFDGQLWMGIVFVILTSFADMLDGATARAGNMGTVFGGILDHVSDRYGEFFILIGLGLCGAGFSADAQVNAMRVGSAMFAIFGMLIASYTRAAAESMGNLPSCAVGMMGRLEKLLLIILGALAERYFPGYNILVYALLLVGVTSVITSVQRLLYAKRELEKRDDKKEK